MFAARLEADKEGKKLAMFTFPETLQGEVGEEQKQLQERVNLALKFVDDVGNPLTAVDGAVDLLFNCWQEQFSKLDLDESHSQEIESCFRILREQTGRMEQLLQNLRRFSMLTDRHSTFTDTNGIIEAVTALVRMEKYEQGVGIINQLDTTIPAIEVEQSVVVFCLYSALNTLAENCMDGSHLRVNSMAENNKVGILIECEEINTLRCQKSGCCASKTPQKENLPPLEDCTGIIRSVIEEHGGQMMVYCTPMSRCGVSLLFPAAID